MLNAVEVTCTTVVALALRETDNRILQRRKLALTPLEYDVACTGRRAVSCGGPDNLIGCPVVAWNIDTLAAVAFSRHHEL